jgi:hypothetical protein
VNVELTHDRAPWPDSENTEINRRVLYLDQLSDYQRFKEACAPWSELISWLVT